MEVTCLGFHKGCSPATSAVPAKHGLGALLGSVKKKNLNIVQVNKDKVIEEILQDIIDERLENGWSVCEAEGITKDSKS